MAWLEAGEAADYRAGVLLLQEHCRHRGLVNHLLKKESVANREKLCYELVKIGCQGRLDDVSEVLNHFAEAVQGATAPAAELVNALAEVPPVEPAPDQVPAAAQAAVDACTELMTKAHTQRVQMSNSLATLDPADGPRVVGEILALQNQYNALAEKRRRLSAGAPAAEPAAEAGPAGAPVDRAALVQQRGNLRSNLSKTRKKAEEAKSEEKKSEYAQKAGKLEVELNLVEMQLAAPQA